MRRLLLMGLAILAVFWWIRRALGRPSPRRRPQDTGSTPVEGDRMVRDRVCNTFIPVSRALTASGDEGPLYFCSEKCRQTYLDSHVPQSVA